MSQRQFFKKQSKLKKSGQEVKFLGRQSKPRDKSSSGDEMKSDSSLKKILYKHEIFDKHNPHGNFKTLHRIKQEQSEPVIKKYKSSQQLSWKDQVIGILQKQQTFRNGKLQQREQREKQKPSSSKDLSKYDSKKMIEILEIENHEIMDEGNFIPEVKLQKSQSLENQQPHQKLQIQQKIQLAHKSLQQSTQTKREVIQIQKHSFNRDQEILSNKFLTNTKFLIAQTSQLLSYSKHLVLQQQISQTKKRISELNITIRRLRINMRNHEYTKEINFTFPVEKHNDEIMVKMPQQVEEKEMSKYCLMVEKIQAENKIFLQQQQKIDNLKAYYDTLKKKYSPVLENTNNIIENQTEKLTKSKFSQSISIKSSKIQSSLASSNSRSPIKNTTSQVKTISSVKKDQKQLLETLYLTQIDKRHTLRQSTESMKHMIETKTNRLIEQINLLKKQISLIDHNVETAQQMLYALKKEIQNQKHKKYQNYQKEENTKIQYQKIAKERTAIYEKEKQLKSIETKGFTMFLRQNKSLSPLNYGLNPSYQIARTHSPRNIKGPELNKLSNKRIDEKSRNNENPESSQQNKILK